MKKLTLEEVKALESGELVYLEEIGVSDSEYNGIKVVYRFEDAPYNLYMEDRKSHHFHRFKYEVLDDVYEKYWLIYK